MPWSEDATYSAWELAGDQSWCDQRLVARTVGGRVDWEDATASRNDTVRLARLVVTPEGLHQINRYVAPETPMRLVRC